MGKNIQKNRVFTEEHKNRGLAGKYFLINTLFFILFSLLALYLTVIHNRDYLFKLQDLSLFLPTKMFFIDTVKIPGGFLTYVGLFFTQFFYYPWLGGVIFISLLLVVQFLTAKAFNLRSMIFPLSFIPSSLLLLALSQLGYYIFILYLKGYVFSHLFGIIITLGVFWIYRNIRKSNFRLIFSLLFILFFFPTLGFYSLFTAFLFVLFEAVAIKKDNRKEHFISIVLTLIFIFAVPFFFNRFIYVTTIFPNIYVEGLPSFSITLDYSLYLPLLSLFIFLIGLTFNFLPVKSTQRLHLKIFSSSSLILAFTLIMVFYCSYNDENFRTELAMDRAISTNDWNKVLKLSDNLKGEPTRLIVMDTYLALRKLHIAGDKMFSYKNGKKHFHTKKQILLIETAGKMLYYQYGKANYCYRWCMEDMMNNGMKVENLKYFVKSCLLNKEYSLAQKYNDVLMKTLFTKSWAKKYQKYIENPETMVTDPEFKGIIPLLSYEDELFSEDKNKFEEFLRYSFATATTGTPEMQELSLQCILEYKNINAFWPSFQHYVNTHKNVPTHYQEAALLFYSFDGNADLSKIAFNADIISEFKEFAKMKNQYKQYPADKLKTLFFDRFGKTYWYYYFFF
jgi:hypothetical protein